MDDELCVSTSPLGCQCLLSSPRALHAEVLWTRRHSNLFVPLPFGVGRVIPAISQKMLIQQRRQMEQNGIVRRVVHHQVPPKVEYGLTAWGQALCPALDALLQWAAARDVTE